MSRAARVVHWGVQPYQPIFHAMQNMTTQRTQETQDEIWVLEHSPVFTQGYAGRQEHFIRPHEIPVVQTDRGGQVTYHGPGQVVIYPLIDLRRAKIKVHDMVRTLEQSVIDLLQEFNLSTHRQQGAPGIYVDGAKLASVGLRVRRGCSYHGLALNVAMDLEPFSYINPCGYAGLKMVQLHDLGLTLTISEIKEQLIHKITENLAYTYLEIQRNPQVNTYLHHEEQYQPQT